MTTSPDLGIPFIDQQQGTPEVTHNEALLLIQALLGGVISVGLNTPAVGPTIGDSYVIGTAPTGVWAGRANCIAIRSGTAWDFIPGETSAGTPIAMGARQEGLRVWNKATDELYIWSGTAWGAQATGGAEWTEHFLFDHAVSGDTAFPIQSTGIVASEILVLINVHTKSVSGSAQLHASVNNGSTYYTSSGDYATLASSGAETAATNFLGVPSASAAARTHWAHIMNNGSGHTVKVADVSTSGTGSGTKFMASLLDIDALSINSSGGGNITGGTIQILTR